MSIVQHKIENQQEMAAASASIGNGKVRKRFILFIEDAS